MEDAKYIIVPVELVSSDLFKTTYLNLVRQDKLSRLIIDEAHLAIFWNDFRPSFNSLANIRKESIQLILLTGSLPPSRQKELTSFFCLTSVAVTRESTVRRNITYSALYGSVKTNLNMKLRSIQDLKTIRGIIFVRTFNLIDSIINYIKDSYPYLRVLGYCGRNGPLDEENRKSNLKEWSENLGSIIVTTSALGHGYHIDSISFIFHISPSDDLVFYAQETGRGGRDQQKCDATIFYEDNNNGSMLEFLKTKECRRMFLHTYLDGPGAWSCQTQNALLCDNCLKNAEKETDNFFDEIDDSTFETLDLNAGKNFIKKTHYAKIFIKTVEQTLQE